MWNKGWGKGAGGSERTPLPRKRTNGSGPAETAYVTRYSTPFSRSPSNRSFGITLFFSSEITIFRALLCWENAVRIQQYERTWIPCPMLAVQTLSNVLKIKWMDGKLAHPTPFIRPRSYTRKEQGTRPGCEKVGRRCSSLATIRVTKLKNSNFHLWVLLAACTSVSISVYAAFHWRKLQQFSGLSFFRELLYFFILGPTPQKKFLQHFLWVFWQYRVKGHPRI